MAGSALLPGAGFLQFRPRPSPFPSEAETLSNPLGRIGALEIRLAEKAKEVRKAQRLRYRVFFEEMSAQPDAMARLSRRDVDAFDAVCDHLVVLDHTPKRPTFPLALPPALRGIQMTGVAAVEGISKLKRKKPRVVGTYRLLRREVADRAFGFYTAGEFAIAEMMARHAGLSFLELGRSCVLKPYRDKRTVELLWHGIWAYVLAHRVDVMLGCASLDGTDPEKLSLVLSYLHHFRAAPPEWNASPLPGKRATFKLIPREEIDQKAALKALPPLVKGYLRIGAYIGDGAVVDEAFGVTDVLVVLPRSRINPRYVDYYGADAARHAA